MMRHHASLAIAAITLAGCTPATQGEANMPPPPSTTRPDPQPLCGAELYQKHVGEVASEALLASIRETQGKKPVRVLKPGSVMTMDYRGDRLNVEVDADNVITRLHCG
ncbi:hypothetical protein HT136_11975 [Novosphingobium profundi]|uniref:I78 family peptidase inhibitor n=1 Tax=Novosphingobium profundi TaxID=1774954 RepID=UPI001BDA319D|nr:I78 family peptidase inhibitor [Novosphingobium profundi]MBT0669082.1 hypothetical protein [Novosphingobium profundi]